MSDNDVVENRGGCEYESLRNSGGFLHVQEYLNFTTEICSIKYILFVKS